ncbi:MAG: hypothetical protein GY747_07800 [Planctomycetes bacterium]|nr:hypothetical protein [Planctomycetota bacterium]MCP4770741.1 hypothetical protein [Planctomycetota bacterium]MCP4862188.1 hypothetical protein [Planctomycetota bacterium]
MIRPYLALISIFALSAPLAAQNARDAVLLDPTPATDSFGPVADCRDELSAIAFVDKDVSGGDEIWVAISNDRGLEWPAAMRVDQDTTGSSKTTQADGIYVFGETIYIAWSDTRNGNVEIYMNHSNDGGVTWQGEQLVDKGEAVGVGTVDQWAMRVSPRASNTFNRVYFVTATTRPGTSDESLYFTASEDGAINFTTAIHLPAGLAAGTGDVANVSIDIRRKEADLFVVWQDNRLLGNGNYDVYAQQSMDAGVTWRAMDQRLNDVDGSANGDLDLSIAGPWYIVGWMDDRAGTGTFEARFTSSDNYGIDWLLTNEMAGNYTPGVDNVSEIDVWLNRQIFMVGWVDDRSGTPEAFIAGNDTFATTGWVEFQVSSGGAVNFGLDGHHDNCGAVWNNLATGQLMGISSFDQGVTWADPQVEVSTTTGQTTSKGGISYNKNFSNFIMGWDADDLGTSNVYAGGYRPHTLIPIGPLTKGSNLSFEIKYYPLTNANEDFGVLYAAAPGVWRLPDGRRSGLADDNYLAYSLTSTLSTFKGTVSMTGTGQTGSLVIPMTLPDNFVLYCVAISAGAVRDGRGALTDLVPITILP